MAYPRTLGPIARARAAEPPIVAILGPRQAGKSTLCVRVFGHEPLVSLETLEARESAGKDPVLIEIKSTRTVLSETMRPLEDVAKILAGGEIPPRSVRRVLVQAGDDSVEAAGVEHVPWPRAAEILAY